MSTEKLLDEVTLTKHLVSIPSYVDDLVNESVVADYIFRYLTRIPFLRVTKQRVRGRRNNILALTRGTSRVLFCGHMDTVKLGGKYSSTQSKPKLVGSKLFGLGSLDTKGGIATLLAAISKSRDIKHSSFLFYCDEEYDFLGMKKFLLHRRRNFAWKLAIVIEPTNLEVLNMHRGLIELSFNVIGKSGHAANSRSGVNSNFVVAKIINGLEEYLKRCSYNGLLNSSFNPAFIRGGLYLGNDKNCGVQLGKQGNIIANFCEVVLDIRNASAKISAGSIERFIRKTALRYGANISGLKVRHDLGMLYTGEEKLKRIKRAYISAKQPFKLSDPSTRGFGDGQLIQEATGIPVIYIGPSGNEAHGPNEHVDIPSLLRLKNVYSSIINEYES